VRDDRKTGINHPAGDRVAGPDQRIAAVAAFDRHRHERARAALLPDSAADFGRPSTTAGVIDYRSREHREVCRRFDHAEDAWVTIDAPAEAIRTLERLTDVEERHLLLTVTTDAARALPLAERAVAHRRSLARCAPHTHGPLLSLSLVLLTHCLQAVGRRYDAVARGQESVDLASRLVADGRTDTRPALVLALDASLHTRFTLGRERDVSTRLRLATAVLRELVTEEPAYQQDLDNHLAALDELGDEWAPSRRERARELRRVTRRDASSSPRSPDSGSAESAGRDARLQESADALYEHSIQVVTGGADGPAAAAAAGAAVAAYRRLRDDPGAAGRRHLIDRKCARALWRHAIVLHELLDRPRDALGPGRAGVALGHDLLLATAWNAEAYSRLVGEVATATHDLSRIAAAAGLDDEHVQLTYDVEQLCAGTDRATTRAVGAALHNRAAYAGETALALARRDRPLAAVVAGGIDASARAVTVRRGIVDDDEPVTRWELANSLLALGHLRCLNGEGQVGAETLVEAYRAVAALPGPSAAAMRRATYEALRGACLSYRDLDIGDDWPL
jgi:hypothetical protein